jgi:D-alanyl-D-alanine carboxypeptidase (penicillin-binding protein 5/6)
VKAPIAKGQQIGMLTVTVPDVAPVSVPLVAGADVAPLGHMGRIGVALSYYFGHRH